MAASSTCHYRVRVRARVRVGVRVGALSGAPAILGSRALSLPTLTLPLTLSRTVSASVEFA